MSFWYWLIVAVFLVVIVLQAFALIKTAKLAREDKDVIVRRYAEQMGRAAGREKRLLDRLKAVLDDLKKSADDNDDLAKGAEDKWQGQIAEHHRGRAAACRQLLARHRG